MRLDFPGVRATLSAEALVVESERALLTLSSAVVGGGLTRVRHFINLRVPRGYTSEHPEDDLLAFAQRSSIAEPFVGFLTAASMDKARAACLRQGDLAVAALVTAGLSNPSSPGVSAPGPIAPGTINAILLIDATLTPGALVNAVITATEAKAQALIQRGARTREGHPASGTSTDAIAVACTGRGESLRYAGPAAELGWLIGRSLRDALERSLGPAHGPGAK